MIFLRYLEIERGNLLADAARGDELGHQNELLLVRKAAGAAHLEVDHIENVSVLVLLDLGQRVHKFLLPY
jgi:transcriptional antiterminator Rof (Rho-off)